MIDIISHNINVFVSYNIGNSSTISFGNVVVEAGSQTANFPVIALGLFKHCRPIGGIYLGLLLLHYVYTMSTIGH